MIWVDRYRTEDGKVIKPSSEWFDKAKRQTEKAIREGEQHKVSSLYTDVEVKKSLEKLFYDKCAYCESSSTASNPWEVEHYRPKGRVCERPDHPGYYWLAYTWENLYPSCTFCNQKRKDQPRYDDDRELAAQGKLDQFPIENESDRAMSPDDDIIKERPYLLDPCQIDPERHLAYDVQGQIHPIDEIDLCAKETIRICHLNRRRLRDARARVIIRVSKIVRNIRLACEARNEIAKEFMKQTLEDYVAPDAAYAGAARAVNRDPDSFITTEITI